MSEPSALINIGELSKPVTTLIEKIADATGVLYEPQRIRRRAKAEADADLVKAQTHIAISDLQRRALQRFVQEEGKKQANIEDITEQAIPLIGETSTPENVEEDWIANFFDKCRIVSDEEMQKLWSKILAGEANTPGSISVRTVNLLASLDKSDAELFAKFCGFCFFFGEIMPMIFDEEAGIYNDRGITFSSLSHLDSIGLVTFNKLGYLRKGKFQEFQLFYYGEAMVIEFPDDTVNTLQTGCASLTQSGQQLAPICKSEPVPGFQEYVAERLIRDHQAKIWSPYPRSIK